MYKKCVEWLESDILLDEYKQRQQQTEQNKTHIWFPSLLTSLKKMYVSSLFPVFLEWARGIK